MADKSIQPDWEYEFGSVQGKDGEESRVLDDRVYASAINPNYDPSDEGSQRRIYETQRGEEGMEKVAYGNILGADIEGWKSSPAWAQKFNDSRLHDTLGANEFAKLARQAGGYTGPEGTEVEFLLGMRTANGAQVPHGQYGGGAGGGSPAAFGPSLLLKAPGAREAAVGWLKNNNPALYNSYQEGYQRYGTGFDAGDGIAALWTGAVGGMAASAATAGAGAAGAAGGGAEVAGAAGGGALAGGEAAGAGGALAGAEGAAVGGAAGGAVGGGAIAEGGAAGGFSGGASGGATASGGGSTFIDPWEMGMTEGSASAGSSGFTGGAEGAGFSGSSGSSAASEFVNGAVGGGEVVGGVGGQMSGSTGLIDSVLGWAKTNPMLASTATNVAGGFIKGAFAPSPEETFNAQYQARLEADQALLNWIKQNNSLRGVNVNRLLPNNTRLRRGGIINSAR